MAASRQAAQLTAAHKRVQALIARGVIADTAQAVQLLDLADIDKSVQQFILQMNGIVATRRRQSEVAALRYYQSFRIAEIGKTAPIRPTAKPLNIPQLSTSFQVTGPVALKKAIRAGQGNTKALRTTTTTSSASAVRHVLNAGRELIHNAVTTDRAAMGWQRVTSGNACAFCAMLASRGPVYTSRDTALADPESHDGCACTEEPIFMEKGAWTDQARQYRDLWDESTQGLSGEQARQAFTEAFNAA